MDSSLAASIGLGVATLVLTTLLNYFAFAMKISSRVTAIEAGNKVFWKILDPHLASLIHSPAHKRRDLLVDKFLNGGISKAERAELLVLLQQCFRECEGDKKVAVALLIARAGSAI